MRPVLFLLGILMGFESSAFTLNSNFRNGWRGPNLKINFNLTNCPAHVLAAFNDAAGLLNSVSSSFLKIERGSTSSTTTPAALVGMTATDSPVIVCDTNFGTTTGSDEDVLAGVGTSSALTGSYINYGGVILNASAGNASVGTMSKKQLAIVLAHEIGHALGFGHSEDTAALMYFNLGYKEHLRLSQDDWDAMTYLYPRDELGGDDLLGCGSIHIPAPPWMSWLLYTLPLALFFLLRRNQRRLAGCHLTECQ